MKRVATFLIGCIMLFSLSAFSSSSNSTTVIDNTPSIIIPLEDTTPTIEIKKEDNMQSLELKIDEQIIDVFWPDNASVNALKTN